MQSSLVGHELGLNARITMLPSAAHPIQRDQAIIANNPLGKVPTLLTDDGQALYDSRVICDYLDDLVGCSLFPKTGAARWHTLALHALGDGMLDAALLARYEDVARPEAIRWKEWRAGELDKIETSLAALERHLVAHGNGEAKDGTKALSARAAFAQRPSMQATWAL